MVRHASPNDLVATKFPQVGVIPNIMLRITFQFQGLSPAEIIKKGTTNQEINQSVYQRKGDLPCSCKSCSFGKSSLMGDDATVKQV